MILILQIGCDGKDGKKGDDENTNYVGPGTFGIQLKDRHVDRLYALNVDGTFTEPTIIDTGCPIIFAVNTRRWQDVDACDPNFDYKDLVKAAEDQARTFGRTMSCPDRCPFREGYPDPQADHCIIWECVQLVDGGGFRYFVSYTGFFVCTDTQD